MAVKTCASGENNILAVAGGDEEHAGLEKAHGIMRAHRAHGHVLNEIMEAFRGVQDFGLQLLADEVNGRGWKGPCAWEITPEQFESFPLKPATGKLGDVIQAWCRGLCSE